VAWSRSCVTALEAARRLAEQGIEAEVIDPRTLRPLDDEPIFESVRKTGRCVVVEEGWPVSGFGAEISDRVQRECFDALDSPVLRVSSADVPMPYAKTLETAYLPQPDKVVEAVKRSLYL
jgi:pyruvate dehydrogenase E1 component beta subunit